MLPWSLSQGCPAPVKICTTRTPRSTSRRASRQASAKVPAPYISRVEIGSRETSKASCASLCIRKAIFQRLNAGLQRIVASPLGQVHFVDPPQQIHLLPLRP